MNALPKTVPVLTAKNMHKGGMDGPNDTHCLLGWVSTAFTDTGRVYRSPVRHLVKDAMVLFISPFVSIVDFNDDTRNSKSKLAAVWNRAMKSLGYVRKGTRFVLSNEGR